MLLGAIVAWPSGDCARSSSRRARVVTRTPAPTGEQRPVAATGCGSERRDRLRVGAHAQSCDLLEAAMEHDEPMPIGPRAQVRWNVSYASELCRRAVDRLYAGAGAGAAHDGNVLQSVFRDVNTATHHALLDFDTNIEIQGKHLLGVQLDEAVV